LFFSGAENTLWTCLEQPARAAEKQKENITGAFVL
jgi:hypothetical protein